MEIFKIIKEKIKDKESFLKSINYNSVNIKLALKRLNDLIEQEDIVSWLNKSNYDFKYSNENFLRLVFKECNIPESFLLDLLKETKKIKKLDDTNIIISTKFKRTTEPIMVLAAISHIRKIKINPSDIYGKTLEEEYDYIVSLMEENYKNNDGFLKIFGKINSYSYESKQNNFKILKYIK